jgi:hypothetical protein
LFYWQRLLDIWPARLCRCGLGDPLDHRAYSRCCGWERSRRDDHGDFALDR